MDAAVRDAGPPPPPTGARRRPCFPSWPTRAIVLLCLLTILVLRLGAAALDHATVNVATFALGVIAAITLLAWLVLRSGFTLRVRYGTLVAVGTLVAALVGVLRLEHVSGELVPAFRFRWQPHADEQLAPPVVQAGVVDLATTTPYDFPQFLGPQRTASVAGVTLARHWRVQPPQLRWRMPLGAGWSGFAVVNGFAVTMEQRGADELVTCYEAATGQPRWSHACRARHATLPGGIGPRATPTIHGGHVFTLGATGILQCLDGATGRPLWRHDLLEKIGITAEEDLRSVEWGRSGSPLIVDDLVVVPLGGKPGGPWQSLAAFRQATGELVWTGGKYQVSYSSPLLATIGGVRQIVIVNQDAVTGHRPDTGEVLWEYAWPGKSNSDASVSQPVVLPHDCLLLSKSYGVGARLLQLSTTGGAWAVQELWAKPAVLKTKFTSVVLRGHYVYGLSDGILECVAWATGERQWKAGRYGPGQILAVNDLLLVQAEDGPVALVEATPEEYRELGAFPALDGKTWSTLCLSDHLLLVRNAEQAACYELP